jgi:hypothetical protein
MLIESKGKLDFIGSYIKYDSIEVYPGFANNKIIGKIFNNKNKI